MKVKQGFVMRTVAGQAVVIATGEASKSFQGMIRLNETGKVVWQGLTAGLELDQIAHQVAAEFSVDADTAMNDVAKFVDDMRHNGFLDE